MIEVGVWNELTLTFDGPYDNCWNDYSELCITVPEGEDKCEVFIRHNGMPYELGTVLYKNSHVENATWQDGDTWEVIAEKPSGGWDDITIEAIGQPLCGTDFSSSSSNSGVSDLCSSETRTATVKLTAYRIRVEVMEKPYGCDGWDTPEDGGLRVLDDNEIGENEVIRQWYHLWQENENAIRANVEPGVLTKTVKTVNGVAFNPTIATEAFAVGDGPNPAAKPKWWKITENPGLKKKVTATIVIDKTGSLTGTKTPVDIQINKIEEVKWLGKEEVPKLLELEEFGSGYRVFPERDFPGSEPANLFTVGFEVVISQTPEFADTKVYFKLVDLINRCKSAYGERVGVLDEYNAAMKDNNGEVRVVPEDFLTIPIGSETKSDLAVLQFITACAGDNYGLVAFPTSASEPFIELDEPVEQENGTYGQDVYAPSDDCCAPMLTVWRTLWVEVDVMSYDKYDENDEWIDGYRGGIPGFYNDENGYTFIGGLITQEFEKACIVLELYPTNDQPTYVGMEVVPETAPEYDGSEEWKSYLAAFGHASIPASKSDFWTVYAVAACAHEDEKMSAICTNGMIMFFAQNVNQGLTEEGFGILHDKRVVLMESDFLHELGHCFALNRDNDDPEDQEALGVKSVMLSHLDYQERFDRSCLFFNAEDIRNIQKQTNTTHTKTIQDIRKEKGLPEP